MSCMPKDDARDAGGRETLADLRKKVTVAEERLASVGEQLRETIDQLAAAASEGAAAP